MKTPRFFGTSFLAPLASLVMLITYTAFSHQQIRRLDSTMQTLGSAEWPALYALMQIESDLKNHWTMSREALRQTDPGSSPVSQTLSTLLQALRNYGNTVHSLKDQEGFELLKASFLAYERQWMAYENIRQTLALGAPPPKILSQLEETYQKVLDSLSQAIQWRKQTALLARREMSRDLSQIESVASITLHALLAFALILLVAKARIVFHGTRLYPLHRVKRKGKRSSRALSHTTPNRIEAIGAWL